MNWRSVLFNVTFALNCMLLFLVLFESRLALPPWLQVVGRMHPLLLHFPLVLIVVYAVLPRSDAYKDLLLVAAFTAALTAIMGLFLSREEGYDQEALQWHKWGGATISVFTLLWYRLPMKRPLTIVTSILALFLIVFTGHLGASITHGDNFLLAPVDKPIPVPLDEAKVYQHLVRPVLQQKCMTCHNSNKAKGE
ncbi:MAG TPA: hypothetical protein VEB42_15460, partial [Chitinophagaceae bacterium]|nr:hypothetical protein [Chitinophagaceae bacterium]